MRCIQGNFCVGYRIKLSAYLCVQTSISGVIYFTLNIFFVRYPVLNEGKDSDFFQL
jgi:hypothetical protein